MNTIQINLTALKWLCQHNTLTYEDIVSRCHSVSLFRMTAIRRNGAALPHEVPEIAQALSVPALVLTDVQGRAFNDYVLCHQVLEREDDIANTAFLHWAVEHAYNARNTTGLPLDPKSAHDLYWLFMSTQV